jgi:Flp pilus assembly protein TadD
VSIEELSRWVIGLFIAGITVLVFVIKQVRDAASDRGDVFKQQIEALKSENEVLRQRLNLKDDSHSVEKMRINQELESLRSRIEKSVPVTLEEIAERPSGKPGVVLSAVDATELDAAASKMKAIISDLVEIDPVDAPAHISQYRRSVAKAAIVSGNYVEAAEQLGKLSSAPSADWSAYLREGVAYANQRGGSDTNLKALRAYSQAIALAPHDLDADRLGKLFIYRGAMLKRLNRLLEARNDLSVALSLVKDSALLMDAHYNVASIEAASGNHSAAIEHLGKIAHNDAYLQLVRHHRKDYFAGLEGNSAFEKLVSK